MPSIDRTHLWGTKIRERMLQGEEWRRYVPEPVCTVIDEIQGIDRLRQIHQTDQSTP